VRRLYKRLDPDRSQAVEDHKRLSPCTANRHCPAGDSPDHVSTADHIHHHASAAAEHSVYYHHMPAASARCTAYRIQVDSAGCTGDRVLEAVDPHTHRLEHKSQIVSLGTANCSLAVSVAVRQVGGWHIPVLQLEHHVEAAVTLLGIQCGYRRA